jgi:hypothetical protein
MENTHTTSAEANTFSQSHGVLCYACVDIRSM